MEKKKNSQNFESEKKEDTKSKQSNLKWRKEKRERTIVMVKRNDLDNDMLG